jgi:hypothetical protein
MSEYEFSDKQNETFDQLANALQRFAIIFGIWGACFAAMVAMDMGASAFGASGGTGNPIGAIAALAAGAACVVIAFLLLKPVKNFRQITTTKGRDIAELIQAFSSLNTAAKYLQLVLAILFVGSLVGISSLLT